VSPETAPKPWSVGLKGTSRLPGCAKSGMEGRLKQKQTKKVTLQSWVKQELLMICR
jgi:hypothetical protein